MDDRPADGDPWPWGPDLDALVAAPDSHRLLLDTELLRVLEVVIPPGVIEPLHTHRYPSAMVVLNSARIRYLQGDRLLFESPESAPAEALARAEWLAPEGPHAVENIDAVPYRAIRFELKGP